MLGPHFVNRSAVHCMGHAWAMPCLRAVDSYGLLPLKFCLSSLCLGFHKHSLISDQINGTFSNMSVLMKSDGVLIVGRRPLLAIQGTCPQGLPQSRDFWISPHAQMTSLICKFHNRLFIFPQIGHYFQKSFGFNDSSCRL